MSEIKASYGQPAPSEGDGISMHDKVVDSLMTNRTRLIDDIRARRDIGLARYGTTLQSNNGRNPLLDMYQELLDALVYAEQYKTEGGLYAAKLSKEVEQLCLSVRSTVTDTCGDPR